MIPARVISSTSNASLRMRWSTYCSEVTAAVNGATNAACTTEETALTSENDSAAYWEAEAAVGQRLQDQADRGAEHASRRSR